MARGGSRRTYVRDGRGRFASTPGGGPAKTRPAAQRAATRAGNRLNRDNSGRITGIGRDGATVRGGRLRTAKGNQRATQTARLKSPGFRAATIARGGRGVSGSVARSLQAAKRARLAAKAAASKPATTAPAKPAPAATQRAPKARGPRVRLPRMATPAQTKKQPRSREARLAAAYLRAEKLARQRKEQFAASYRTAVELRLDAQGIKSKKKREAALKDPQLEAAAATSRRRHGQKLTSEKRAAELRAAYLEQLSKGTGQKGRVATPDRKRYDMLKESAYRLGQSISRDSHNLAYNTNSMSFAEETKVRARFERNKRIMQRKQALIKRLANVSSVAEAPDLQSAWAIGKRIKAPRLRPGRRSNSNLSSGVALVQSMPYIVKRNGRISASIYPQGRIDKIRAKRAGGPSRLRKPQPKPPAPLGGNRVYRTRQQSVAAQRARSNAIGRRVSQWSGDRIAREQGIGLSVPTPRVVVARPRVPQLTLSGGVQRVGAGRFRVIGERTRSGSIRRARPTTRPLPGSPRYRRELQRLVTANGGKDVAAFRF